MKELLYSVTRRLLKLVFPDNWVNKDTVGAVLAAVGMALLLTGVFALLAGCHGGALTTHYQHHSSIPNVNDLATSDAIGGCGKFFLQPQSPTAAHLKVCIDKHIGKPSPFGQDPTGTIEIEKPILTWGLKR